jgi:hypothetical protein
MMKYVEQYRRQNGGSCPGTGAGCVPANVTYTTNQTVGAIQQFYGLIKDVITFVPDINAQMGKVGGPMIA